MGRTKNIVIAILAAVCVGLVCLNVRQSTSRYTPRDGVVSDTTRVVFYDTIKVIKPIPRDSIVVSYITDRLPIERDSARLTNEASNVAPDMNVASKEEPDSANVIIPISSKEYRGDDYRAWVSGYRPSLDSIYVFPKHETITITNTPKMKRWSIGIQAGYGFTQAGVQPYIGIGIGYTLFSF